MPNYETDFDIIEPLRWKGLPGRYKGTGRDQIAQGSSDAISAVAGIMQKKKRDRIANALLDSRLNGNEFDAKNASQLFGGSDVPDYGGMDALSAYQKSIGMQQSLEDRDLNKRYKEAQIGALGRKGSTGFTPYQAWRVQQSERKIDPFASFKDKLATKYGLTPDDVTSGTAAGTFYQDATGQQLSAEDANGLVAAKKPVFAVVTPQGKSPTRIPLQEWGQLMQLNSNLRSTGQTDRIRQVLSPDTGGEGDSVNTVTRVTKDGRRALFDAKSKQFVRYLDDQPADITDEEGD